MAAATFESPESIEHRATALLQPHSGEAFRVIYDPAFPRSDGSTFSWFQVVFAVGPADDAIARTQVHERFVQLLTTLAPLPEVQRANTVALRARRRVAPRSAAEHPHMFIECAWHGESVADMQRTQSFASWYTRCYSYVNRFDHDDPLNPNDRSP